MACPTASTRLKVGSSVPDTSPAARWGAQTVRLGSRRFTFWTLTGLLVLVWSTRAFGLSGPVRGIVTFVADGDTVYVRLQGQTEQTAVRILGIDAPEICQDGGPAARQALQAILQDQTVDLHIERQDDYGRQLALIFWQGRDVGRAMVQQGLAWSYRHGRDRGPYLQEQQAARAAGLGLFAQPSPLPPAVFRRQHGSCRFAP